MQRRLIFTVLIGAAVLATAGSALATQPSGFTGTTIGKGQFAAFNVNNYFVNDKGKLWLSLLTTKGKSDGYIVNNDWQPGGTTGWHTHPGPTLIIVTVGTITHYDGDDPTCTPHVYTAGMTFVDRGGNHVHIVRNETAADAQVVAFRLVPTAQAPRIDAPDPGNCPF